MNLLNIFKCKPNPYDVSAARSLEALLELADNYISRNESPDPSKYSDLFNIYFEVRCQFSFTGCDSNIFLLSNRVFREPDDIYRLALLAKKYHNELDNKVYTDMDTTAADVALGSMQLDVLESTVDLRNRFIAMFELWKDAQETNIKIWQIPKPTSLDKVVNKMDSIYAAASLISGNDTWEITSTKSLKGFMLVAKEEYEACIRKTYNKHFKKIKRLSEKEID